MQGLGTATSLGWLESGVGIMGEEPESLWLGGKIGLGAKGTL